jgi:hypothetical protein
MTAPGAFVSATSFSGGNHEGNVNLPVVIPSTSNVGDVVVVGLATNNAVATVPTGWTSLSDAAQNNNYTIASRVVQVGDPGTTSVFTSSVSLFQGIVALYAGSGTARSVDQMSLPGSPMGVGSNGETSQANEILIAVSAPPLAYNGSGTAAPALPAGFTQRYSSGLVSIGDKAAPTAGTIPPSGAVLALFGGSLQQITMIT